MIIFANATRGLKYTIALEVTGPNDIYPGTYQIHETTSGRATGFANLGQITRDAAVLEYNRRIAEYAQFDGIFFTRNLTEVASV